MPRFGKDKNARNEELDRQAAEEVERLTRRGVAGGGGGGMGGPGMPGMGGPPRIGPPSPLEMMAAEVADRPPPSRRKAEPARRPTARPQQAFTPMPSGEVGSSFGPGGLNPGPRGGVAPPPPPAFGGGAYQEDFGGQVTGPPVYNAEPDEDEEMSITEMALMDHAARTGHNPEDLVMMYDAGTAEEMRDRAMRQFYERQASSRPGGGTNDPFAPAGKRRGPSGPAAPPRRQDPAAAGGALAQRLAARRRQEEQARAEAAPPPSPAPASAARTTRPAAPAAAARPAPAERQVDEGALARVLARRRAALGVDAPTPPAAPPEEPAATGSRHAAARGPLRSVPEPAVDEAPAAEAAETTPTRARKAPAKSAKAPAKRATRKAAAAEPAADAAPLAMPPVGDEPAAAPPAKRSTRKATVTAKAATKKSPAKSPAKKGGATLATPAPAPAKKTAAAKKTATRTTGKAKTIFCIECGEKNPAIAKFCFNCGTRLAAPEG